MDNLAVTRNTIKEQEKKLISSDQNFKKQQIYLVDLQLKYKKLKEVNNSKQSSSTLKQIGENNEEQKCGDGEKNKGIKSDLSNEVEILKESNEWGALHFLQYFPAFSLLMGTVWTPNLILELHPKRATFMSYHDERLSKGFRPAAMPLFFYALLYSNFPRRLFIKTISRLNFLNSEEC